MTTITCEHCESEIDVAKDPKCVVYEPSGATDVICKKCKEFAYQRWRSSVTGALEDWPPSINERRREAYRIKRGWRA